MPDRIPRSEKRTGAAFAVRITVEQGGPVGQAFDVRDFPAVIGRGADADIQLEDDADDPKLSRHHARVDLRGGCIILEDLSRNGTYVGERRIGPGQSVILDEDALVRLGPLVAVRMEIVEDHPRPPADSAGPAGRTSAKGGGHAREGAPQGDKCTGATVAVQALGPFQLTVDGVAIPGALWSHRKSVVMLVYLADTGRPASADRISEVLWPDALDGRQAVQTAVSRMRGALKEAAPQLIRHEQKLYSLGEVAYDATAFERGLREAQRLSRAGDVSAALQVLEPLVALYRGPFLEGFEEGWVLRRRTYLEECWFEGMTLLASLQAPEDAVRTYRALITASPTREQAHLGLIRALARMGRRDDALRQCLESMTTLRKELGVPAGPEMQAVHRELTSDGNAS